MPYIRKVHVQAPGTRNEHILEVKFSSGTTGALESASRAAVAGAIDRGVTYRTHNDRTGSEAPVKTRVNSAGTKYITTEADGVETNNLLALDRY